MKPIFSYILTLVFFFSSITNCSEYFGRKPPSVDYQLVELLLQYASGGGSPGCRKFSMDPIRGGTIESNGTRQGFEVYNCRSDSDLNRLGILANNLEYSGTGIIGSGDTSRLASNIDFLTVGGKKQQSIEVSFILNQADSYLDVVTNAQAGSNAVANGPGFRIQPTKILAYNASKEHTDFTGLVPTSGIGVEKTYCLEIHDEGNAHIFGWSRPCGDLSEDNRSNYEFEIDDLATTHPGSRVGFVLHHATLLKFVIGERIGLSE